MLNVGDAIQYWTHEQATRGMMELARYGVIVKEDPNKQNRMIVESIDEERYREYGKQIQDRG